MSIRFSFGGVEHILAEVSEEMSLEAFFTSLSMTNAVKAAGIKQIASDRRVKTRGFEAAAISYEFYALLLKKLKNIK